MNLLDLIEKPVGATHYFVASSKVQAGGSAHVVIFFFKKVDREWVRWWTDPDNEYPHWWGVAQIFREGFFDSKVLPKLLPIDPKP
jgi:hypothetical protein